MSGSWMCPDCHRRNSSTRCDTCGKTPLLIECGAGRYDTDPAVFVLGILLVAGIMLALGLIVVLG